MIGYALCGSFCTHSASLAVLEELCKSHSVLPIVSEIVGKTDTRFGNAADTLAILSALCRRPVIRTIRDAEPIGPKTILDALVIAPCTGNTLAKIVHGITDTTVTMAAKAHLRNSKPLVIAFSTNDALSGSAPNIAGLLNRKNVYFVPFRQDDPVKKPFSMASDFSLIAPTVESALAGRQLQPLLAAH